MRAFTFLSASFLLLATSAVACAASEDDEPDPNLRARATSAAATVASSECDLLARCHPETFALRFPSKAVCETQLSQQRAAELQMPGVRATPESVAACATARAAIACSDQGRHIPQCHLTPGTKPRAQSCASDLQCDTGRCLISPGGTCGACVEPVGTAALGEACSQWVKCQGGLHCQRDDLADGGVCVPRPKTGEPCMPGGPACTEGLKCVDGACSPPGLAGAPCKATMDCLADDGLACVKGACTPRTLVAVGEPCGATSSGATAAYCKAGGTCLLLDVVSADGKTTQELRCAPEKALGQACDAGKEGCEGDALCLGGTCSLPPHVCDY